MGLVVALAGGAGAAKLLRGLIRLVKPSDLMIVGNTGDDFELFGLNVSPDLDIIMYTLAGVVDETKGWGISGDTFHCLGMLGRLGAETWFRVGDKDFATHVLRTEMLRSGKTLSEATAMLCEKLGVRAELVPMSNDPVRTKIVTAQGCLGFQEYFVKRETKDQVIDVVFDGAEQAKPCPEILSSIREAELIVVCPSNPILSISPILAVPAIGDELRKTKSRVVGVSPIVGGKAIKGPADRIMASMGFEASAYGVGKRYQDLLDCLIIDAVDGSQKERIEALGMRVIVTNTLMKNLGDSIRLAEAILDVKRRLDR